MIAYVLHVAMTTINMNLLPTFWIHNAPILKNH